MLFFKLELAHLRQGLPIILLKINGIHLKGQKRCKFRGGRGGGGFLLVHTCNMYLIIQEINDTFLTTLKGY